MTILAIDTSCDDTAIAVVESKKNKVKVLSNVVSSQVKLHQKYGGVYPSLAKREHQKNLPFVLRRALKQAGLNQTKPKLNAIAVTIGPGLEPCLWQGINFAKELAQQWPASNASRSDAGWQLPIIPVNHIEAHLLINFAQTKPKLPAIALVVSGGHSQLILVKAVGKYKIIGETRDDAAGECFDKTARILGLKYPGGPEIAKQAKQSLGKIKVGLPRPMLHSKDYDFSFSGLKTAVLYDWKKRSKKTKESKEYIRAMTKEIQQTIIDVLIKKTIKAAQAFQAKTIILGGGVSANQELRQQMKKQSLKRKIDFLVPLKKLSTDNAVMIGVTGLFHQKQASRNLAKIKAQANLRI